MDAAWTPSSSEDHLSLEAREATLRSNLSALRNYQPEWAARIEACPNPRGAVPCKSRDGMWSWRLACDASEGVEIRDRGGEGTTSRWLGRTSMPGVSAKALFENVQRDGGVVLPGFLSGAEALELCERIAPTAVVFVLEPDVGVVRLVLQMRDFAALIEQRRLVFVAADDAGDDLARFFEQQEGFEFPSRLLRTPQTDAASFQRAQACVERAAGRVREQRERRARELTRAWGDRVRAVTVESRAADVRAMIVTASRTATARSWTGGLASAAEKSGRAITHMPDRPDRADWGAALASAAESAVNVLVAIDARAAEFARLAPEQVRSVCWLTPETDARSCAQSFGLGRLLLASTAAQLSVLASAGVAADLLEPPVAPREMEWNRGAFSGDSAILIDDAPSDEPEGLGVGLPSHRALLDAARAIGLEKARASALPDALDTLVGAEQRTGMAVEESDVRAWLAELVRSRIIPAARRRAVIEAMQSARLIRAAGGVTTSAAPPSEADARAARPRVWVRPLATPADASDIIAALCAGVHVVAWRYAADLAAEHPMLHPGLAGVAWYDRPTEAVRLAQKLLASREPPSRPSAAWLDAQGMAGRWASLLAMPRGAGSDDASMPSPG